MLNNAETSSAAHTPTAESKTFLRYKRRWLAFVRGLTGCLARRVMLMAVASARRKAGATVSATSWKQGVKSRSRYGDRGPHPSLFPQTWSRKDPFNLWWLNDEDEENAYEEA